MWYLKSTSTANYRCNECNFSFVQFCFSAKCVTENVFKLYYEIFSQKNTTIEKLNKVQVQTLFFSSN